MSKINKFFHKQENLFIIFLLVLLLPNLALAYTEHEYLLTGICNIIFPLGIYWLILSLAKKPGNALLCISPLLFFGAFQMVLLYLFGNSVIAVDMFLNIATTNSSEVGELLGNLIPAIIGVLLIYGTCIVLMFISIFSDTVIQRATIKRNRIYGSIITVIGMFLIILNITINQNFKISNNIYPINATYNLYLAIDREIKVSKYHESVKSFNWDLHSTSDKPQTIILVIGETARACNFEIYGYGRETTPNLCKLHNENCLYPFDNAITQSNTTHKSVPLIMSAVDASTFDDIYTQQGVISAFKKAGYKTSFISNQRRNHSFIDFFGEEADNVIFLTDSIKDDKEMKDCNIIPAFEAALNDSTCGKKFIVLHTYGSHFAYHERYPESFAYFKPDKAEAAEAKNSVQLTNAYDNTIRYTDSFINDIISRLKAQNIDAALLYTSDHGEDIFDDDRNLFLHASPKPSFYQLWVPYFVWVSDSYKTKNADLCKCLNANIHKPLSSNDATFHTLLSLGRINGKEYNRRKSLASKDYECKTRYYVSDHNKPVDIAKVGFAKEDYVAMSKYNKPVY